jgi:hypothetical protein
MLSKQPNLAVDPTPNSRSEARAKAVGRGSPPAFGPSQTLTMALHDEAQNLY